MISQQLTRIERFGNEHHRIGGKDNVEPVFLSCNDSISRSVFVDKISNGSVLCKAPLRVRGRRLTYNDLYIEASEVFLQSFNT